MKSLIKDGAKLHPSGDHLGGPCCMHRPPYFRQYLQAPLHTPYFAIIAVYLVTVARDGKTHLARGITASSGYLMAGREWILATHDNPPERSVLFYPRLPFPDEINTSVLEKIHDPLNKHASPSDLSFSLLNPSCVFCPYTRSISLTVTKVSWQLLIWNNAHGSLAGLLKGNRRFHQSLSLLG